MEKIEGAGAFSNGARYERKAILAKIRREIKEYKRPEIVYSNVDDLREMEQWVLERRKRYESKPGGLGRKKK